MIRAMTACVAMTGVAFAGAWQFSLRDTNGAEHRSSDFAHSKAVVLMFVATDCPNSNTYAPVMARLYRDYSARGIAFFNVYSDPTEGAGLVRQHEIDFKTPFPALLDPKQVLARQTGAKSTPEVAVVGPDGTLLYRGRIDNRFVAFGKTRFQPTENDLQGTLDSILEGKPVAHRVTTTVGCAIPGLDGP